MALQDQELRLSRRARRGALALLGLLLLLTIAWRLLPVLLPPHKDEGDRQLQQAWTTFREERITKGRLEYPKEPAYAYDDYNKEIHEQAPGTLHMAPFDPNTAGEAQLLDLGLPLRTVRTLIKYRSKGGHFRKKEDLQKLYTLDKADYERIAPFVHIEGYGENSFPDKEGHTDPIARVPEIIELNSADAGALMSLRGIGPGYSRRILAFREALGGFLQVEQLKEVYGFPDSTYQQLKDRFSVDAEKVKRININTATEEELGRHPYIGKKLAVNIIKLRNDLKTFSELVQMRQVPLINEEKYRKIAPYLSTH